MKQYSKLIATILFCLVHFFVLSQGKIQVYTFDMKEEIGPAAWRITHRTFKEAVMQKVDVVLIKMNTYGGMVDYADSIRTKILESPIKTIVFIDNNAASAGALIAIACDKIYMRKGASMGAASVVNPQGEVMPEKYQSYMRGLMRSTAEAKNRDPKIAEAFVDPNIEVPDINPKGKVLTLTTSEAIKVGFCVGEANTIEEVLKAENITNYEVHNHKETFIDKIIAFLINPAVSGILILLIIGGIYFEMQSPGIGFALLVSIVAGLLYFAPLYLEGLAANWEIALFIVGVILLALEIFVIPGFGVAGITGFIFIISGLALSLVMNDFFDFTITGSEQLVNSFILVAVSMIGSIVLSVIFGKSLLKTHAFKRLVLQDEQRSQMGYVSGRQQEDLLGKVGVAKTDMRPSGKIQIDGRWYDALALDGYITRGSEIIVEKQENYNVFVRRKGA